MTYPAPALSASLGAACLFAVLPAFAAAPAPAEQTVSMENTAKSAAADYWTAERFKAAKPLPLPAARPDALRDDAPRAAPAGKADSGEAQPPSLQPRITPERLFDATPSAPPGAPRQGDLSESVAPGETTPQDSGSFGTPFTSTRVFPLYSGSSAGFSADRAYPYITVGKLFFTIGGSPFVCSASVIQRRVVVTAGHCVHSGTAAGFHSNWVFVPAFRDGVAPLKQWSWRYVIVTGTWASGGGTVPNAADYAMIEFGDQPLTTGGPLVKLGNLTGWLGWQTLSLNGNHTSKLGYPCNLDNCQKMQNVTSTSFRTTAPNNVEYGSDARGGSSGGPWVQNFAVLSVGGGTGTNAGQNRVVGVTSYGYNSVDPKVQGAAIPDSRWVQLWNTICARAGNCN